MTEIEFFKEFEIEPKYTMNPNAWLEKGYPQITAEIVLGLEEVLRNYADRIEIWVDKNIYVYELIKGEKPMCSCRCDFDYDKRIFGEGKTHEEALLNTCKELKGEIKPEVQKLFGIEVEG